jgi:hypothetical protein
MLHHGFRRGSGAGKVLKFPEKFFVLKRHASAFMVRPSWFGSYGSALASPAGGFTATSARPRLDISVPGECDFPEAAASARFAWRVECIRRLV